MCWRVHIGLAHYGHSGLSVWLEAIWYQPHKGRRLQTHSSHPPAWLRSKDHCSSARRMWTKFTWNVPHQPKCVTDIILLLLFSTKIKKTNKPTKDLWDEELFRAAALVGWLVFFSLRYWTIRKYLLHTDPSARITERGGGGSGMIPVMLVMLVILTLLVILVMLVMVSMLVKVVAKRECREAARLGTVGHQSHPGHCPIHPNSSSLQFVTSTSDYWYLFGFCQCSLKAASFKLCSTWQSRSPHAMVHRSLDGEKKPSFLTLTFAQYNKRELVGSDSTLGGKMGANRQQIGKCSGRQNGKFHSTHQTADPGHICCPSSLSYLPLPPNLPIFVAPPGHR